MIRSELVARIAAENHHLSNTGAEKVVATVFNTITEHLETGGRVELRGFGIFTVQHYDGGKRRNPRTGEITFLIPKSKPFFKIGRALRNRLNPD